MSPTRHDYGDLENLRDILTRYPGSSPVILTVKDTLGHLAQLELGERFRIRKCPELDAELSIYN